MVGPSQSQLFAHVGFCQSSRVPSDACELWLLRLAPPQALLRIQTLFTPQRCELCSVRGQPLRLGGDRLKVFRSKVWVNKPNTQSSKTKKQRVKYMGRPVRVSLGQQTYLGPVKEVDRSTMTQYSGPTRIRGLTHYSSPSGYVRKKKWWRRSFLGTWGLIWTWYLQVQKVQLLNHQAIHSDQ